MSRSTKHHTQLEYSIAPASLLPPFAWQGCTDGAAAIIIRNNAQRYRSSMPLRMTKFIYVTQVLASGIFMPTRSSRGAPDASLFALDGRMPLATRRRKR